ncbi:16S rRNA (guanine(527)-N(7))-methyltransferase RsmG [Desulfomonile tiedjei]|nr:16S rRNA (guanine(527)-N(7))-methyltransferase RsmG [Desulfomonile tiedjei]
MMIHFALLREWGEKINLTALSDPQEIAVLHYLDSLAVFKVLPVTEGMSVLDIGSGAGFPGLVIKIANENIKLTLLDRDAKKIVFLKYAASVLQLREIRFLNISVQTLTENPDRPAYDVIVSRAFSLRSEWMTPLGMILNPRGMLVRMAGPASRKEDLSLPGFELENMWEGHLPFSSHFRRIILYRKIDPS